MTSESSFTGFREHFIGAAAADLYVVSILCISLLAFVLRIQGLPLPRNLDFFALEGEYLSHDIFGLPSSPHVPPFPASEDLPGYLQQVPPGTPSTPGAIENIFHPIQTSHETLHSRAIVAPRNIVRNLLLFSSLNSGR